MASSLTEVTKAECKNHGYTDNCGYYGACEIDQTKEQRRDAAEHRAAPYNTED